MILVVNGYKDNGASGGYTWTRNRSFDSSNTNYMIPRKSVKFDR